jgi:alpha-1,2-glucosyltransferase
MARYLLVAGLLCLAMAAAAYGALLLARGPAPVFVHIRWAPGIDDFARQVAERRYTLSEAEPLEDRTWGYTLNDLTTANVRALVTDPAVEDTQGVDRAEFRASPSAERRPYPASDSPLPVALFVVTVACLFFGLTGVSVGLIERAARREATAGVVSSRVAEPRAPRTQQLALLLIPLLLAACYLVSRSMELRVDERNHLNQIQRYLAGNFVTTSTASGGFHAVAAAFARVTGLASQEGIRLFVVLIAGATILTFRSLAESVDRLTSTMRTLQFTLFPLLFPFWFVIYTDVFALLLLLPAVVALTRHRFHLTGILGALGIAVRQTSVVWLAMLAVWTATVNRDRPLPLLARRLASFATAAVLFGLFVLANRGVAIGDRDSHPEMELHTENLLFMAVCFCLLFFPLIVSRLRRIVELPPALVAGVSLGSALLFFGTFRVDHPYNAVMSEDVFVRNGMLRVMTSSTLAGIASAAIVAVAVLALMVIRLRQPVHYLIYPFAALSVMPVWLIEQRYYLPAFALFMAFREPASPAVERAILAVNAALSLYLFAGVVQGRFFL